MALSAAQCSRISNPYRPLTVTLEVRVMEDGTAYWCDMNRSFPAGAHTPVWGDPGEARLLSIPTITMESERGRGHYSTRPISVDVRNDDGLFFRTAGLHLLDATGVARFLPSFKKAWVRLKVIEGAPIPGLDDTQQVGYWYIDKITGGSKAELSLQPLERFLQTTSPKAVKSGNRWFREADVGELFHRVARNAMPGMPFESGSPPGRIRISARPGYAGEASDIRIGPVIDNLGRQPERSSAGLLFDSTKIPTAICEDSTNPDVIFYAIMATNGFPLLYKYTISTGVSDVLWSGVLGNPVCYIANRTGGTQIVFATMGAGYPAGFTTYNRNLKLYRMNKTGSPTATLVYQGDAWANCDAITQPASILVDWPSGDYYVHEIGIDHWQNGARSGRMLPIGFPQLVLGMITGFEPVEAQGVFRMPAQREGIHDPYDEDGDPIPPTLEVRKKVYDCGGWTCAFRNPSSYRLWSHHNPFPTGIHYIAAKDAFYWIRWHGDELSGSWRLMSVAAGTGVLEYHPLEYDDDGLRQRQPTMLVPVSGTDDSLGAVNWLMVGTYFHRMLQKGDGSNFGHSAIYKIDLDDLGINGFSYEPELFHEESSTEESSPWPIYLDGAYVASATAGTFRYPYLVGCYLDRKTRLFKVFLLNLGSASMQHETGANGAPASGGPLVGFRAWEGELAGDGRRRCFFRDCGSGMLWEWISYAGNKFRTLGEGMPVDPSGSWEAVSRLALIQNTSDPADSRVLGFSAPSSPFWVFPWDANGNPKPNPVGSFRLWSLAPSVTVRVPIGDFSEDQAESSHEALEHLAQAAGSNYTWGINRNAQLFLKTRSSDPVATLVPADEEWAHWGNSVIPILSEIEREDQTEDDVANQVLVTPWVPEVPAVSAKLELVPRDEGTETGISVSARAATDAAVRVVLNVLRDGMVGSNQVSSLNSLWDTTLLLLPVINTEDILTELAYPTGSFSSVRVRGMSPAPGDISNARMIAGAMVYAKSLQFSGDYIVVGDSSTGRIVGFSGSDTILVEQMGTPDGTVPEGTTVRIQPCAGRGAKGQPGLDGGGLLLGAIADATTTTVRAGMAEVAHPGDVAIIDEEALLIKSKRALSTPEAPYTHELEIERGYLGTTASTHSGGAALVCVHPTDNLPRPIGASGLTVAFDSDPTAEAYTRLLKSGDRLILEYPGTRAAASKYNLGVAEGAASVSRYGKREFPIKENPYISTEISPHYAYAELQERQWERARFRVVIPFAVELSMGDVVTIRSRRALPDENGNELDFWITGMSHSERNRQTVLSVLSTTAVTVAGTGKSAGTGEVSSVGTP